MRIADGLDLCRSAGMRTIQEMIGKIAGTNAAVLIRGESGVGKELVAHAIHRASPRANKQLLKVNCAALPGELLESELFGHQRGAFTGAYREKPGKFEIAHQGSLMLDEIGEVPLRLQAKLLHVLQDGEFSRVGGERIVTTDVRVIAATNRDLEGAMRSGQFREDLYYRLNVIELRIPPLRERRDEIPVLIDHFLGLFNAQFGRAIEMPAATVQTFLEYSWPGNIRELENTVKRIVVLGGAASVHAEVVTKLRGEVRSPAAVVAVPVSADDLELDKGLKGIARRAARDAERVAIKDVLERVHWNRVKAARLLQISYKALLYKIVQCGLATPDEKAAVPPQEAAIA